MKFLRFKISILFLALATLAFGTGCGGGSSTSTNTQPPPQPGSMAGAWDISAVGGGGNPVEVQAVLAQDKSGNISGSGTVTANGPVGNIFEADLFGTNLSSVSDLSVDYLGNTCGADTGNRSLTGTINSSNKVSLTYNLGGSFTVSITGTLNSLANPPFSGTFTVSAPGCNANGETGNITAVQASLLTGTFSGTSAANNNETITLTLTDASGALSGTGNDSVSGNFTFSGTAVANAFSATMTPAPSVGGTLFGYFDPQLGAKGSILLTSFQGGNAASCPNGVPIDNGSCLIAVLAMQ